MTIWRKAAERAVRWHAGILAGRMLTAATYGDWSKVHVLTARAVRHGPAAVGQLVTVWCEAILSDLPPSVRGGVIVQPVFVDPGHSGLVDADQAPPPVRWVGRVLAAAANRDQAMLPALVDAVPAEDLELYLAGLLRLAVAAVLARDDEIWP